MRLLWADHHHSREKINKMKCINLLFCLFILGFVSFPISSRESIPILFGTEDFLKSEPEFKPETNNKQKKAKIPILWGGSSLTQEERLVNGIQMKTFILGGGAYIQHKSIKLMAKEIEILGEDALVGNLKGQVIVEDLENGMTLYASKGVYDKMEGTVSLENKPYLVQKKDKKRVKIKCDSIVRYLEEGKTNLSGPVVVTSNDFQLFGENAVFLEKEDRIDLQGEPFLFSENRYLIGNSLNYFVKEGTISLRGDANIYQVSFERGKKAKTEENKFEEPKKIRRVSIFSGDSLSHLNKGKESVTSMNGNAYLYRETSEFRANDIESRRNNEEISAIGNVSFLDKESYYKMEGGVLKHDKIKKYSYLTENPKIYFLDKKDLSEKGNLSAVVLERFEDRNEMVSRGNVVVETATAKAKGEFATYFEKEDRLVLEGNPSLVKDNTQVSSGKIIMFPKEDKVLLSDGLKVIPNAPKK